MNKRIISCVLAVSVLCSVLAGCSSASETTASVSDTTTVETSASVTQTTEESETTEETAPSRCNGHYTFQTHVFPSKLEEIMGPAAHEAYDNMIDAVLAGEDYFDVADSETYDWVIGQFAYACFPVIDDYIESAYAEGFSNGRGKITYLIPKEELQQKIADFEQEITDILNENLEDDYSDFEKALALYLYMSRNYTYDYYMMDHSSEMTVSAYQTLQDKSGICQGLSELYSFLLLEAGVDATVMKSLFTADMGGHQWSYVKINGQYYHIDPTFALQSNDSLEYFMMNDSKREEAGYDLSACILTINYGSGPEHGMTITDDTYSPLWNGQFSRLDRTNRILYYWTDDADFNRVEAQFDYGAVGN